MDFELSEEQQLLKQTCERYFADHYQFESRRRYSHEPRGWSLICWKQFADLGLLGLPFAEDHGGFGGGPVETMIVMEQIGRVLLLEPYLATVVLGGGFIARGGSDAQRAELLPKIAAGDLSLSFAHAERQARYELANVATTARRDGSGYILDGAKTLVLNGDTAEKLVVSARVSGTQTERSGLALFLVDATTPGVLVRGYPTVDGLRAAEVTLSNVRVETTDALGEPGAAFALIARIVDEAIAALCAEAVGAMAAMHEATVAYMKTRKQFGVAIGSFQVLQHRAADMLIAVEQARSMAMLATMMATEDDARERRQAISAAKVQIGRSGRFVGQQAIQIHGGIGMTMETMVGHHFKRLAVIDTQFGDADHHLDLVAAGDGLIAP
jgi:pimeloyl-CoA dehydrogenase small subunit